MSNRRQFLRNSLLLAGAAGIGTQPLFSAPLPPAPDIEDAAYWKLVRSQFPLSPSRIFLNNGTVGPSPYTVLHEIQQDMLDVETYGRYGGHEEAALKALADFLGTRETEISLTHNVTEGINITCWGLPLKAGDEVIMTGHEHVGHATPWLNRAKLHGIIIRIAALGKTAGETFDNIKNTITKKTKVISVPHIPCTNGQVLPVKEICALAKEKGIFSLIDGAHPPGMLQLNIKDLGCDFYAGCCHKWMLGPKGTGFLYVSEDKRNTLQAYYGGGGFDTGWDMLSHPPKLKGYAENGHRYYYGTRNASLYKGIVKSIAFQEQIGRAAIENRVRQLGTYLQEHLLQLGTDIEMLTPTESISRAAQVSFRIRGKDALKLHTQCSEQHIITRYVAENNINCLRISAHIYNSTEDIDALLMETDKFIKS